MMRRLLLFLPAFLFIGEVFAQSSKINRADSIRIKALYKKAFAAETYSQQRQLILDSILMIDRTQAYAWQQKGMPLCKQKKYELGMSYIDSAVKYDKAYQWL